MNHNTCSNINTTDIMPKEYKQQQYTLYDYISMKLEKTNLIHSNRNHISGCLGIEWEWLQRVIGNFQGTEKCSLLSLGWRLPEH